MLLAQQFSGLNGFLGTRGSFMLDFVFLAMFAVVPLLGWGILLAKQGKFLLHKRVQIALALILLTAVVAFEVDMRVNGWIDRAIPSPYFDANAKWSCPAGIALIVHLCFAVPTALLWIYVVIGAMKHFPKPPVPGPYSMKHKFWAWLGTIEMIGTAVTGWIFYWMAFIAAK